MTMNMNPPMPGDIDGDGCADKNDLALLREILSDSGYSDSLLEKLSPEDKARLDVNKDGVINHADVMKLCEIMMGSDREAATAVADKFQALRGKSRN